jgi:hypothetical protein
MTTGEHVLAAGDEAPTTVSRTAWLAARGRQDWPLIVGLLGGCTCAWADLDGFHLGAPPAEPPLATHLWAWSPDRLLRIRMDGSDGIVAELHLSDAGQGEPVEVTERDAVTWMPDDGRVSADDQWRGRPVRIYEVTGLMPLEFARLGDTAR